jgi:putative transposase
MAGTPASPVLTRQCNPFPPLDDKRGIDLGIEAFATLSDGERIFSPGWYRKAERSLKTAQRHVSRRKKGSDRRRKAVVLLAEAYQKVKRQRKGYHHKTALALVQNHDTISHEDLQTANRLKHHHLAKCMADAGWSEFLSILSFKAACAGRSVIAVQPTCASQTCSGCGALVLKGVSVRWHSCPESGASLPRDHNAAKNRERLRLSYRGKAGVQASEHREPWGFSPSGVSSERKFYRILSGHEESFAKHGLKPERMDNAVSIC